MNFQVPQIYVYFSHFKNQFYYFLFQLEIFDSNWDWLK
jgi:hypothetical protein